METFETGADDSLVREHVRVLRHNLPKNSWLSLVLGVVLVIVLGASCEFCKVDSLKSVHVEKCLGRVRMNARNSNETLVMAESSLEHVKRLLGYLPDSDFSRLTHYLPDVKFQYETRDAKPQRCLFNDSIMVLCSDVMKM